MSTLAEYRTRLRVDKRRIDDELEVQAETQDRIAQEAGRAHRAAEEAEDRLKRTEARLFAEIKERDERMAIDKVNMAVRRHPERVRDWEAHQDAQDRMREWYALLDAWKVKGFTLRDLGALYASDYFSLTQTSVGGTRPTRGDFERLAREIREADEGRGRLREASARAEGRSRRRVTE